MALKPLNEFLIRYTRDRGDINHLVKSSCKSWSRGAIYQLRKKLTTKTEQETHKRTKCISLTTYFDNGSEAGFLFVPPTITTYDLHSALRYNFAKSIKDSDNISFNIKHLKLHHQKSLVSALTSLIFLIDWSPPVTSKAKIQDKKKKRDFGFYTDLPSQEVDQLSTHGEMIAKGTNLVRTLSVTPANILTPFKLRKYAENVAIRNNASFGFWDQNSLEYMKAGCFQAVIQSEERSEAGIAHLTHKPKYKRNLKKIILIGKGVTFDAGGYNLKTEDAISGVHRDMTGAAVVLALFEASIRLKVNAEIHAYLAIAENHVSPSGMKPNDVVTSMDGRTVEILDTDAEGRLLLADTILLAKEEQPALILDFATLTGTALEAATSRYSAVFSNKEVLGAKAVEVGHSSGERVCYFPSGDDFLDELLGTDVADIKQCSSEDDCGDHIYAATFLRYFVGEKIPWVHVDLSAEHCEASNSSEVDEWISFDNLGLVATNSTGFGVRWGFDFITEFLKIS